MEHPDLAQFAAVVAAAGAVLLLAGRGRILVLGGLGLLAAGEGLLALSISGTDKLDTLTSPPGAGAAVAAAAVLAAPRHWRCAGRPGCRSRCSRRHRCARRSRSSPAAASRSPSPRTASSGRLLPLYFVLAAAALALAWRACARTREL